jgi:RsiW-degrading membrane proteinase PrsW (M82 family)
MAPPGNDDRDDRWNADGTDSDRERLDSDGTGRTERPPEPAPLNEGVRLAPEDAPRSTGLNEKPPRADRERRNETNRPRDPRGPARRGLSGGGDSQPSDPVQASFAGRVDLYEIASWEARSPLDRFAVRLTNTLEASKRLLLLSFALALFVFQVVIAGVLIVEAPILGALAALSVLPALGLAGYFWYGDRTTREPLIGLAVTFLLAVGFASVAGVVNSFAQPFFQLFGVVGVALFYFLIVGPIEETVKWLAVRVYAYRSDAFQTVVDGVVYGAMAGVGFAAIENLLYILMFSVETTAAGFAVQQDQAIAIATQRAFVGPGHVIFSAWAGFYLGLSKFNHGKRGPIVVKGLMIAAFIHALYNTLVTNLPLSLLTFIGFLIVYHGFWFTILYRKIRSYRSLYQRREQHHDSPPN